MTLSRCFAEPRSATFIAVAAALLCTALLAGCNKSVVGDAKAASASTPASAASVPGTVLLISPEDLRTVGMQAHASGPVITGSIQPERRADLRAEVSAVVLQVLKENGEVVHKGDLLVRLDDTSIRDSLTSADASSRAAAQALDQAQRQYTRMKTLQAEGMTSQQALDDAEVRAPFDGVVSDRKVSAGDTAAIGKELVKVIDPTSMRFEGLVSADRIGEIAVGQTVMFRVNGFDKNDFVGKIRHVDASADDVTRQVSVIVDFAPGTAPKTANLFAEGRISTGESQALLLPEAAVTHEGDNAFVWRVAAGKVSKTPVKLGERDARRGEVVIASGIAGGDQVLRAPGSTLADGQKVELAKPVPPSTVPNAATAAR